MAWSRTNPAINTLSDIPEETKGKENKLFGTGFLERAAKRLEDEKALPKVTVARQGPPPAKCHKQDQDPNDFRRFFGEWHPCKTREQEPRTPTAVPPEKIS